MVFQIAIDEVSLSQRGIFAVHASLDLIAYDERLASCTVICTSTIILHTATKFRPHKQNNVASCIMGAQVFKEGRYSLRNFKPAFTMVGQLYSMQVETSVGRVEDACS